MVSRAKLLDAEGFSLDVPSLPSTEGVQYPAHFNAEFDRSTRAYRMVFSGLSAR